MNPSTAQARIVVDELIRGGVRDVVLCPGSRNAPLAFALAAADRSGGVRLHVRIDERTAGYLAVGLALGGGAPVCIVMTSGTAVANLGPAVVEANYARVPLIVLSANRPYELLGTGANQTMEQFGYFGTQVRANISLGLAPDQLAGAPMADLNAQWRSATCRVLAAATGSRTANAGPVQFDIPLREPLVPDSDEDPAALPVPGRPGGGPWTYTPAVSFDQPLDVDLTPDTVVNCPATIVVGKRFKNAEGEVLGRVPFRTDFAKSCNTAFVGESTKITPDELTASAAILGYRQLDFGIPVFGGSVPGGADTTEHAADMIGQGKVEASPLAVALVSASVAAGRSLIPRLIVNPNAPAAAPGEALPPQPVADLRSLMRSVVVSGTGTAVKRVPGGEVSGKTGTAEFGTESPPRTHAWFTGFQGDIAFAVLVQDGGFGGAVAAPIAARFLTTLAG